METVFQPSLFEQSTRVKIMLSEDHDLVKLTNLVNWDTLEVLAANIRESNGLLPTGRKPHYRQLLGALALMAVKNMTYREAEDQISHYAPARYLCGLMDSDMSLDHVTIFEFTKMLGPKGVEEINEKILLEATSHGFLDSSMMMSDTTAQEAKIPYPNEEGLMQSYMAGVSRAIDGLSGKFKAVKKGVKEASDKVKHTIRHSKLFGKAKESRKKNAKKIYRQVKKIHQNIQDLLLQGRKLTSKSGKELTRLQGIMSKLLPQIWHFLKTGFVAKGKILSLTNPDVYAINRGKAGKTVEFGIKWGINRIGCGFVQGFTLPQSKNVSDHKFCIEALELHQKSFGEVPVIFGFDRGAYSPSTVKAAADLGVKHVGIAPKGKAKWDIPEKLIPTVRRERALVEGAIGTLKTNLYGFNKPEARSKSAMETCGQRSILGFNMKKMVRELDSQMMEAVAI